MEQIIFYILAAIILTFSLMTVTSKKILRAAIYLLFTLCATAGLYFMFEYNFLAAVQLTVYAGGVVVLVVFSILLTAQMGKNLDSADGKKVLFGGLASFTGAMLVISVIANTKFITSNSISSTPDVKAIGRLLLSYNEGGYVLPFEVISILLLAAMVGAIVIAKNAKVND